MAELKDQDQTIFDYAQEHEQQQPLNEPDATKILHSPADRLKRVTRLEKVVVLGMLLLLIGTAIIMVNFRNEISKTQNEITSIQAKIDQNEKQATQLQQEKNELSRSERLKKVAEKAGLTINDDNLRKVK